MNLTEHTTATRFLERTLPFLIENEAANNLIIGLANRLAQREDIGDAYLVSVEHDGDVVAAAVMTPPYKLAISYPASGLETIVENLIETGRSLSGVVASKETAGEFVALWKERTGIDAELQKYERIYRLESVTHPENISGSLRVATEPDLPLLLEWGYAFNGDIGYGPEELERVRASTELGLSEGRIHIWEDEGVPVSMAAWAGPTPNGVRVNFVYTPPEFRRRGYASASVAALSQKLLDSGRRLCFLYTDLENPTSNSIYQKLGYTPVCDVDMYMIKDGGRRTEDGGEKRAT